MNRYAVYVDRMQPNLTAAHEAWLGTLFGSPEDAQAASTGGWTISYGEPVLTREKDAGAWWTVLRQQITVSRGDVILRHTSQISF